MDMPFDDVAEPMHPGRGPMPIEATDPRAFDYAPPDLTTVLQDSALANSVLPSVMQPAPYLGDIVLGEGVDTGAIIGGHRENLALALSEQILTGLEMDLTAKIEADYATSEPWREMFKKGMILMGIVDDSLKGPFTHASQAVHPMIAESCIRFWARTLPEILPQEGPAKGKVIGKVTAEKEQQSIRVGNYMNYQITKEDVGFRENTNKLIFQLPLRGVGFRKTRYDEEMDTIVTDTVSPEEMIAQYGITSFRTCERFTHRYKMGHGMMLRKMANGTYREVELHEPQNEDDQLLETQELKDQASGTTADDESNIDHTIDEVYAMLSIEGDEDLDETGQPTGLLLPYIVTIEKTSGKILSIYRDWRESDPMKARIRRWTKYEYLPGFGFYGLGLIALIGSLADQATAVMRIITNGAALASMPGGFRTKDSRIKDENLFVEPGVFKAVDGTYDEISKAFYTPTFQRPDPMLVEMLSHAESLAQRITSTTDLEVGAGDGKAPVGTTMALLEKAQEVSNAIQGNIHASMTEELEIRYEFTREHLVEGRMRSFMWGDGEEEQVVDAAAFDPNNTWIAPTSDPSQGSIVKRLASAQLVYQTALENPDVMNKTEAITYLLQASEVPDFDRFFQQSEPPPELDPISEGAALMRGEPIKAYETQDHLSHIKVHQAFMQNPQYGGNPDVAEAIGPMMAAHLMEHLAYQYMMEARMLGVQIPGEAEEPLPPEIQTQVAVQAAMVAPQLVQIPGMEGTASADAEANEEKLRHLKATNAEKERHLKVTDEEKLDALASTNALKEQGKVQDMVNKASDRAIDRDAKKQDNMINQTNKVVQMRQQQAMKPKGTLPE